MAPDPVSPSGILVPAQGALLGVYYGADSLAATATKVGRTPSVHLTYYAWDDDWAGGVSRDDLAANRIPLVNWEPYQPELGDIVAGEYDTMLHQRAAGAKALGKPFFLDFGAEMNGDWSPWGGAMNGMSPDVYLAAYRHVHDLFVADGVTNAVWLWCPNVTDEPRAAWNATLGYYPGDAYVDWTCVDGYNWGSTQGGWQAFQDVFEGIYPKLAGLKKPIMIGEMASAEAGGDKAAWIDAIIPTLRSEYPLIKGLVWFDINKETDWRISSSPAAEAAWKRMATDPFFNP
ncbi:MAG TPA: glycosyl hydrolase [Polyangiales bacterium]|nr:glycosyl hydrolase [Polyangiales bacterium]